jgi:hypothetical protein
MSVIGNFNGSPIIATPSPPGFRQVDWTATDIAAVANAPFTGAQQVQSWQAAYLSDTVTMPPMKRNQVSAEDTFPEDIPLVECETHIRRLAEKVWNASKGDARQARTVVLKLKTKEFSSLTRSLTPRTLISPVRI